MNAPIEIEGLPDERNFNNSICEFEGKLLMAYRAEDQDRGILPHIKICELDEDFKPSGIVKVHIEQPTPQTNLFEDPRLFVHNGELWMSFVAALYTQNHHWACQGVAKLDANYQPTKVLYPNVGENHNVASTGGKLAREKNWTFFSLGGFIWVIYSINPLKMGIMNEKNGAIDFCEETRIKQLWRHGDIHGGTGLVETDGLLVGAFHSFTREKIRNYHMGFYAIDPVKGLVDQISAIPWGSAAYDDSFDKRPLTQSWRPNVMFPCGMIKRGDEFWISYGWQDCRAMLVKVPEYMVWDNLQPVKQHFKQVERYRDLSLPPSGGFKVTIQGTEIRAKGWQSLKRSVSKYGINERELEDMLLKTVPDSYKRTEWAEIK